MIPPRNVRRPGFATRTDVGHINLPVFHFYKQIMRAYTDVLPMADAAAGQSAMQDFSSALRGESWAGLLTYYLFKMPGAATFELPARFPQIPAISRTRGVGTLVPARSEIKPTRVIARVFFG